MVRSINYGPQEVVDELPDDLLTQFRDLAVEKFGALEQPVVALTNQTMEMALCQNEVQLTEEGIDTAELVHALLIDAVAEHTDYSRTEIISHCTQRTLSTYSDDRVAAIRERPSEIAAKIDRNELWPRFKHQAYQLHGESDGAVIQHIREAMTLVVLGTDMDDLRQGVRRETRLMQGLLRFINERTDFELDGCDVIYEVLTAFKTAELTIDNTRNESLEKWVDIPE